MEAAITYANTDNRSEREHPSRFQDNIGDFAIGVGSVKQQHVVVDIHAGDNTIRPKLNRTGAKVIAIDLRGALGLTLDGGPGEDRRMEPGKKAPGLKLPVEPGSVDIVFVEMVLQHIQTPAIAIAQIKRILKPGGRLVITDIQKNSDTQSQAARRNRWMGFYPGDIRHWLKAAGFSNIIVNPVPASQYCHGCACLEKIMPAGVLMATGTA